MVWVQTFFESILFNQNNKLLIPFKLAIGQTFKLISSYFTA